MLKRFWKFEEDLEKEFGVRDDVDEKDPEKMRQNGDNIHKYYKAIVVKMSATTHMICHDFFEKLNRNEGIRYEHIRGILEQVIRDAG